MELSNLEAYKTSFIVPGTKPARVLPFTITKKGTRLWLSYSYNKLLTDELKKCLTGMKWHGYEDVPVKQWSCLDCFHNWFQFAFFEGKNPYAKWDVEQLKLPYTVLSNGNYLLARSGRTALPHQYDMTRAMLTYRKVLIAGEMGVGKTFATIEAMEASGIEDWLWVGPKSALYSVKLEFEKWNSPLKPTFVTYSGLQTYIKNWPDDRPVHQGLVFDESAKIKTVTSQRSEAAMYLADHNRKEWGELGYIILLSGAPAPKSPIDWYNQCETVQPGFLCEGNIHSFKNRLAIIEQRENDVTGGVYPELIGWRDNTQMCNVCGKPKDNINHDKARNVQYHDYVQGVNEVSRLYTRMRGLVLVKTKEECLNLPEKIYKTITCEPTREIIQAAKLITKRSSTAIKALTLLRELSDGFQYTETEDGVECCELCHGSKTTVQQVYCGPEKTFDFLLSLGEILAEESWTEEDLQYVHVDPSKYPQYYTNESAACPHCKGSGETIKYIRSVKEFKSPKEDVMVDLLDEYDEYGRFVAFAGFTASIDKLVKIAVARKWEYIRADSRGFHSTFTEKPEDMLKAFQTGFKTHPRILFIGNPEACGTGLTLTASPGSVYYSNTFNADARIQSEDRIHRLGMQENRAATIMDLFHLPTDKYVFDNLKKKRNLLNLTLGKIQECFNDVK